MKKLLFILSALVLSVTMSAQSLGTGIQYIGAAASHNATKRQQASARGENAPLKVKFQMDIEVGGRARWGYIPKTDTDLWDGGSRLSLGGNRTITGGPSANLDLGLRFNDSYFIGVGAQLNANFGKTKATVGTKQNDMTARVTNLCLPIYGVFKVYIPSSNGVSPYFDLGIGGYLPDWYEVKIKGLSDYQFEKLPNGELPKGYKLEEDKLSYQAEKGGFYLHAAVGVDINHFQLSAGYELTTSTESANTSLYHNLFAKIGFRIGG